MGLSATPDREELDDEGNPIEYDEHRWAGPSAPSSLGSG